MILRFLIFSLFLTQTALQGLAQAKTFDPEAKISAALLQEDFHILHTTIGLGHPAWGHYYPRDSMELWFRQAKSRIQNDMTEAEFLNLLFPLIGKMGCGHTRLLHSKAFEKHQRRKDKDQIKRRYPPFKAILFENKLFVKEVTTADSSQIEPGSEILSIDNRKASEIIANLTQRIGSDGYNQTHQQRVFNTNFDGYYRFHFGEQDQYQVTLVDPEGDSTALTLPAAAATLEKRLALTNKHKNERLKNGEEIVNHKGYHLRTVPQHEQAVIMDIRGFRQRRGKKFYRKSFAYLEDNDIQTLIIDLRDNGGGAVKDASRLLAYLLTEPTQISAQKKRKKHTYEKYLKQKYLYKVIVPLLLPFNFKKDKTADHIIVSSKIKPERKNHFDGDIFVLVNGRTFSASVMVAAYLQEENRATFIGQETGGGLAGTNAFLMPTLELPHSGVRVIFPIYAIEHQISAEDQGHGLIPDYEIQYSLQDLLEDNDLELKKAMELLDESTGK